MLTAPAILRENSGIILRVLTLKNNIQDISEEVCGKGDKLTPLDGRKNSKPKLTVTEKNYYYLTGRLVCVSLLPVNLILKPGQ
jgi:hypothetical protein